MRFNGVVVARVKHSEIRYNCGNCPAGFHIVSSGLRLQYRPWVARINVTSLYWQDLDLSGFKNLKGLGLLPALNEKLRKNKPPQIHRLNFFLISKIFQLGSRILEFKARFEPLNSQSKALLSEVEGLRTPGYHPPAEESC
jgi:hypothetical protein